MPLFFQNNNIKCSKCGRDTMSLQSLYHFEKGKRKDEIICEPYGKRIICANCGNTVMDIDNFTTIKTKD